MSRYICYKKEPSVENDTRWLGKRVGRGTSDPRIELRRKCENKLPVSSNYYSNVLVTVRPINNQIEPEVLISMNGKTALTKDEFKMLHGAILEASLSLELDACIE